MNTVKEFGIKNYKIVWSEELIPYAYVIPGISASNVSPDTAYQVIPVDDLKYVCEDYYNAYSEHKEFYQGAFWRPEGFNSFDDHEECNSNCGNEHEIIAYDEPMNFVLYRFWQLIPCDENGNDILELAGGSDLLKESLNR